MSKQVTIAESNQQTPDDYLRRRNETGLSWRDKRRLRRLLRAQERYLSVLPMNAEAEALDGIPCYVNRAEDVFALIDGRQDAEVKQMRKSGREFGSLPVCEDLSYRLI